MISSLKTQHGRIKSEKKAPEILKYIMQPLLRETGDYHFQIHNRIHKAHVVMLYEQGLLFQEEARAILIALLQLEKKGKDALNLGTTNTDLYMETEAYVTQRTPEFGGKMHMGRSRNDLYACAARMISRDRLIDLLADLHELQKIVLRRAIENTETVMPGYTHLQHAEPITFGHYLVAFFDALARDAERIQHVYTRTNLNVLGSAALATTSFSINRERTSELLGFEGLVENSYDAVSSRDFMVEMVSSMAILSSNIVRVVDNLIIWSTSEFSMIDLPDEYAYTSSIMPQKRNPGFYLESIRAMSARAIGDVVSTFCTLKGVPLQQSRETSWEITVPVSHAFNEIKGIVNVMRGVMEKIIANRETMKKLCRNGFSYATELANTMVREKGLAFRSAYEIVANVVRRAIAEGKHPSEVTTEFVDSVAKEIIGKPVNLSESQMQEMSDPAKNVKMKMVTGGSSPKEVERMIKKREKQLEKNEIALSQKKRLLKKSEALLNTEIEKIINPTTIHSEIND